MSANIPMETKPHAAFQKLGEDMRRHVEDLRRHAGIRRMPVNQAANELIKYCEDHKGEDGLAFKKPASENPFLERDCCKLS